MQYWVLVMVSVSLLGCASGAAQPEASDALPEQQGSRIQAQAWFPLPSCIQVQAITDEANHSPFARALHQQLRAQVKAKGYVTSQNDCAYRMSTRISERDEQSRRLFSSAPKQVWLRLSKIRTDEELWAAHATINADGARGDEASEDSPGAWNGDASNHQLQATLAGASHLSTQLLASLPFLPPPLDPTAKDALYPQDIDAWLASVPAPDRVQALKRLILEGSPSEDKEKAYVRLLRLEESVKSRREWAEFRASTGDAEGALDLLHAGAGSGAQDAETQFLRGRIFLTLGRPSEADAAFLLAINFNPDQPLYFEGLAHANVLRRNYLRAIAAYAKVLEMIPNKPYLHRNMAKLNVKTGDSRQALVHYVEAAQLWASRGDQQALSRLRAEVGDLVQRGLLSAEVQKLILDVRALGVADQLEKQ